MTFGEAIQTVLFKKYADFTGRATRSEFWYFILFEVVVSMILSSLSGFYMFFKHDVAINLFTILSWTFSVAIFIPALAVVIRRLHDIGKSGWNTLLALIPIIGSIILIVFCCQDSGGENKYGPKPQ